MYKLAGFRGQCCSHDSGKRKCVNTFSFPTQFRFTPEPDSITQKMGAACYSETLEYSHPILYKRPRDSCLSLIMVVMVCALPEAKVDISFLNTACVKVIMSRKTKFN